MDSRNAGKERYYRGYGFTPSAHGSYTHRGVEVHPCAYPENGEVYLVRYCAGGELDESASTCYDTLELARDDIDSGRLESGRLPPKEGWEAWPEADA